MIAASRQLFIVDGEERTPLVIEIQRPIQRGSSWECTATIGWPEGTSNYSVGGFDGMQAMINALQMIAIQLYASTYHEAGTLLWTKPGEGYGFPIAKNGRDLLIGMDKDFFG